MSPVMIRALLEIHALPKNEDHSDAVGSATVNALVKQGLIEDMRDDESSKSSEMGPDDCPFNTTPKGKCYITALCALPLPEQIWMIPREEVL